MRLARYLLLGFAVAALCLQPARALDFCGPTECECQYNNWLIVCNGGYSCNQTAKMAYMVCTASRTADSTERTTPIKSIAKPEDGSTSVLGANPGKTPADARRLSFGLRGLTVLP
jgi:hypothetical protein